MAKQEISKIENFNVNALEEIKWKEKLIESVIKENPFVKIVDNKTYEEGKKSRTALRTCRTDLEKEEKALHNAVKKVLTEPIKTIYGTFKEKVTPLEDKQQEEVKAWEDVKEQERQEKLRIEEARKQKHRDNIEFVFNHNKKFIDELTFENLPHELVFKIDDQEFTSESFEEFADVFEAKVEVLKFQLTEKSNTLQEKENIRLENERLEKERKENERKQNIRTLIDVFYSKWHELFTEMGFEDIKEVSLNFNSEKPIDCAEFQDEYATKRASLVRMLEAKINFLTQAENQRIQQEKLDREQAELEQLNKDLEAKQKRLEEVIPEPTLKGIVPEEQNIVSEPQVNEIEVVAAEIVSGNTEEVKVEEEIKKPKLLHKSIEFLVIENSLVALPTHGLNVGTKLRISNGEKEAKCVVLSIDNESTLKTEPTINEFFNNGETIWAIADLTSDNSFIGRPTTIGELRDMISKYADSTELNFINKKEISIHEVEVGGDLVIYFQ